MAYFSEILQYPRSVFSVNVMQTEKDKTKPNKTNKVDPIKIAYLDGKRLPVYVAIDQDNGIRQYI